MRVSVPHPVPHGDIAVLIILLRSFRSATRVQCPLPAFNAYRRQLLDGSGSPRKRDIATLIQIRDDPGEDRAADRTVRPKG